tara:strand:- start:828 stop:992 length:165 start_codon:yes stop_codon:yes gene_type:complete
MKKILFAACIGSLSGILAYELANSLEIKFNYILVPVVIGSIVASQYNRIFKNIL